MALLECRQVVVWSLPTIALLVSIVWLRRKLRTRDRDPPQKDPLIDKGKSAELETCEPVFEESKVELLQLSERLQGLIAEESSPLVLSLAQGEKVTEEENLEESSPKLIFSDQEEITVEDSSRDLTSTDQEELIVDESFQELATVDQEGVTVKDLCEDLTAAGEETAVVDLTSPDQDEISPEDSARELSSTDQEEISENSSQELTSEDSSRELTSEDSNIEVSTSSCILTDLSEKETSQAEILTVDKDEYKNTSLLDTEKDKSATNESPMLQLKAPQSNPSGDKPDLEEAIKNICLDEPTGKKTTMEKDVLENKLANLEINTMKISCNTDTGKNSTERDSANQSPSEVMLASPSISNFSDAHSEGSSDSGKGHSDVATSPSRTPAGGSSLAGDSAFSSYDFVIPQVMVGRLIGRHGSFIHDIRTSTHTNIFIKRHPETNKLKICAIEGTQQDIEKAIEKIRHKFPLRRFPKLTLEKVSFLASPSASLKPEDFHLQLVEGVNNDVIISSLISAAHFFVQQPSHPSYGALSRLNQVMNCVYSNSDAPLLESAVKDAVCAAPTMGGWYRAQIIELDEETQRCDIRFVDYGGYLNLETASLRQIRYDLLLLPFQAVECYLANVAPLDETGWSEEARLFVQSLTHGQLLQAQIYDYAEDGTPLVYLYSTLNSQIVLVNEELVNRGFASIVTSVEE